MAKESRSADQFWHGIPYYPFSTTPDGRIVGEIHRGRMENKEFQRRALELQERTTADLARIHSGAQIVRPVEIKMDETVNALGQMTDELRRMYAQESETSQALGTLNQITEEGLNQLHEDLAAVRGPLPKEEAMRDIVLHDTDLMAAMGMFGKGMLSAQGQNEVLQILDEPLKVWRTLARTETNAIASTMSPEIHEAMDFLSNTRNLFTKPQAASARIRLLKGFALKHKNPHLLEFAGRLGTMLEAYLVSDRAQISEDALVQMSNSGHLSQPYQNKTMEMFPDARRNPSLASMNFHLADILKSGRHREEQGETMIAQGDTAIYQRSRIVQNQVVAESQRNAIIQQGYAAGLQRNELVSQGNQAMGQRSKLIQLEEAQVTQGQFMIGKMDDLLGINSDIADGLFDLSHTMGISIAQEEEAKEQRNMTIYNLRQIVQSLTQAQDEAINFREMTGRYFAQLTGLLQYHNRLTRNLTNEVITTKLAIVLQIKNLERGIRESISSIGADLKASIERGNSFLERLVFLAEEGQVNKAYQYFRDGQQCLATAENEEDIRDAYNMFCKGIDEVATSVENHLGAGMAAEMLKDFDKAKDHYEKAGKRARKDQSELSSQAYEAKAKIEYEEKDMESALIDIKKAIKNDPDNISARSLEIKYLIEKGEATQIPEKVAILTGLNEAVYPHLASEPYYLSLPVEIRREAVEAAWNTRKIKSPAVCVHVLQEMMEMNSGLWSKALRRILAVDPQILIKKEIWLHPEFERYRGEFQRVVKNFIECESQNYVSSHQKIVKKVYKQIKN